MTNASRPVAWTAAAVSARPSAPRATSATSAPASAKATAIARPMPREAPVTNAFLPLRSNSPTSVLPLSWQRPGRRIHMPHNLIQHDADVSLPHPQVLGPRHADHLSLRHSAESLPGLRRLEVIIVLGHDREQRRPCLRPGVKIGIAGPPERR